jgi:hypothetical protein
MTTYILLRKNKESGPFSLDDLKTQEIHPDDLFWVEGQSVCWQKPEEIKELKSLVGLPPASFAEYAPKYQPDETSGIAEMISGNIAAKAQVKTNTQPFKKAGKPVFGNFEPPGEKIPDATETRYSKPLDDIKKIYLKNLEQQQKSKQFSISIPEPVKKAVLYAVFLLTGLLAGIFISKRKEEKSTNKTEAELKAMAKLPAHEPESLSNKPAVTILPEVDNETASGMIIGETAEKIQVPAEPAPVSAKKTSPKKPVIAEPAPASETTVSKQEDRAAQTRETAALPEPAPAEDISSLVAVATNDYEVGSFGGIRNLQLTVKNDSRYILEDVTVELRYLKPADEVLKTENLHFYNVPPYGSQTLSVPKSNRGVKVSCRVVRIESKLL